MPNNNNQDCVTLILHNTHIWRVLRSTRRRPSKVSCTVLHPCPFLLFTKHKTFPRGHVASKGIQDTDTHVHPHIRVRFASTPRKRNQDCITQSGLHHTRRVLKGKTRRPSSATCSIRSDMQHAPHPFLLFINNKAWGQEAVRADGEQADGLSGDLP